ncbi:sulfite exporter TauE/SafE family protein [Pseudonocardia nantongensis]|uniref:sulfite exporter TauE/SafE family protein n=1 Tax=Pseudonocardia nantongensis TaxID=1181885 RepID=UPI00397A85CB
MRTLIVFALVGLVAQMVDGALGMAYGVTSTSLLLIAGINPATASASVHLAEVGTTLASGAAHWRFGNVDWKLVAKLGVPGAVGAFLGATALSALSTEDAAPYMSGILLALGVYILLRFSVRPPKVATARRSPHGAKFLSPLGLVAGFVDASGGGGWGPVSTPALLGAGKTAPRTVIGSVDTSEFLVAIAASLGFLVGLGHEVLDPFTIGGLLIGGVVAAPLAAWLVTKIPAPVLGTAVGGIIVLTNSRTLLNAVDAGTATTVSVYVVIVTAWAVAVGTAVNRLRRSQATGAALPEHGDPVAARD